MWNAIKNFFIAIFSSPKNPKPSETVVVIGGVPLVSELVKINSPPIETTTIVSGSFIPLEFETVEQTGSTEIYIDPYDVEFHLVVDDPPVIPVVVKPEIEVWVDDSQSRILRPDYWDVAKELGFKSAAIMVDTSNRGWDSVWTEKRYEKVGQLARDRDIKIITTIWPEPNKPYFNVALRNVIALLKAGGGNTLESDMEFNWKAERSSFKTWTEANEEFLKFIDKIREQVPDLRTELTSFTNHAENGKSAKAAPHMDRLVVQAYSVRKRPGNIIIPWDHVYAPGKMQTYTLDRTYMVPGVKEGEVKVSVGLPAWDQEWPFHSTAEAMQVARDACLNYSHFKVESLRYWSSKWIFGSRKNNYAAEYFKGLK